MRALWSIVVVCVVAATTTVRPVEADDGYRASSSIRVAPNTRAIANRPPASSRGTTVARRSSWSGSSGDSLPPAIVATAFVHRPWQIVASLAFASVCEGVASLELGSCSARGPPLG